MCIPRSSCELADPNKAVLTRPPHPRTTIYIYGQAKADLEKRLKEAQFRTAKGPTTVHKKGEKKANGGISKGTLESKKTQPERSRRQRPIRLTYGGDGRCSKGEGKYSTDYGVDPSKWAADRALIEKQCKGANASPKFWGIKDSQAMKTMKLNYGSLDLRALLHVKGAASRTRPLHVLTPPTRLSQKRREERGLVKRGGRGGGGKGGGCRDGGGDDGRDVNLPCPKWALQPRLPGLHEDMGS